MIQLPPFSQFSAAEYFVSMALTRTTSSDVLWFGVMGDASMRVFTLPKAEKDDVGRGYWQQTTTGQEEWVLMHTFHVEAWRRANFAFASSLASKKKKKEETVIRLESFVPWNHHRQEPPVAVLRVEVRPIGDEIFLHHRYCEGGGSCLESVRYEGRLIRDDLHLWPYVASVFLSSFALSNII